MMEPSSPGVQSFLTNASLSYRFNLQHTVMSAICIAPSFKNRPQKMSFPSSPFAIAASLSPAPLFAPPALPLRICKIVK